MAITLEDIKAVLKETARINRETALEINALTKKYQEDIDKAEKRSKERDEQWEASKKERDEQWEADKKKWKEQWEASKKEREAQWEADNKEREAYNKEWRARSDKLDKRIDKISEQIGGMDENTGHHAEQFFQDAFSDNPVFGGIKYDHVLSNLIYSDGHGGGVEFDIVLENGDSVALIEVKNRIHPKFVKDFAENRIKKFREFFPKYGKYKAYLGIAGFSFSKMVLEEARKYGIGIVRQAGKSIEVDKGRLKAYL